jgi:predicted deacetylase
MSASPHYLLRFDDICPTMNWRVWEEVEAVLRQNQLRPILAVVPDNCDPVLRVGPPNVAFWERVRLWQRAGWAVAIHGYQHLYVTKQRGLVGRRPLSEFAGLGVEQQRLKLTRGIEMFRLEGVSPAIWVAPGHTFDAVTVSLLPELGIRIVSDGFFCWPYLDAQGLFWIPQQLSSLRWVPNGVWTVCHHVNAWRENHIALFRAEIARHRERIVSVEQVESQFGARQPGWWDTRLRSGPVRYFVLRMLLKAHSFVEKRN